MTVIVELPVPAVNEVGEAERVDLDEDAVVTTTFTVGPISVPLAVAETVFVPFER